MNALRSSFGEFGFEQQHRPHSPQQKQSLRSSWGGQYGLDGVCGGPNNCLAC
jgi:hypothetical protein